MNIIKGFNRWPISRKISFLWVGMAVVVACINGIMIFLSMSMRDLHAIAVFAIIIIVSVVVGTTISTWYVRWLMRPISMLSEHVTRMAQGDFSVDDIGVRAEDDLGHLAQNLETMTGQVRQMLQGIQEAAESVALSSRQLSASAVETRHSAEISADSTQDVAEAATAQQKQAQETLRQVRAATHQIQEMAAFSQTLYEESEESAQLANTGKERAKEAAHQMRNFQTAIHQVGQVMEALESDVERIVRTMSQIQDIAAQTNLLALNASIEAARAGEAGRGFEIVAQEVRALADESKIAAESIVELVDTIHARVTQGGTMMQQAQMESETCASVVVESSETFGKFAGEADLRAKSAKAGTQTMKDVEASSTVSSEALTGMAETVKKTADTLSTIAAQAQQQVATMEEVTSSADALNTLADELRSIVRRFQTEKAV